MMIIFPKFNIAPQSYPPNRKVVFQSPFFTGYVENFGGCIYFPNVTGSGRYQYITLSFAVSNTPSETNDDSTQSVTDFPHVISYSIGGGNLTSFEMPSLKLTVSP